jgi:hypothetical protein
LKVAIPKGRQAIQRPAEGHLAARIQVQELQLAPTQTTTQIEQPIEIPGLAALRQLLLAPAQDLLAWEQLTQKGLTKGRIAAALLDHLEILKGTPAEARLRPQRPGQFQLKQA